MSMLENQNLVLLIAERKNKGVMIMTIDEAIQKARDNENSFKNNHKLNLTLKKRSPYYGLDCLKISEDNKHLAEWLEELKAYRANEGISENVYRCGYKFGYNKAVDDTIKSIKEEYAFTILEEEKIDEIAEQLKEKKGSDSERVKRTNVMFVANFVVIVMK